MQGTQIDSISEEQCLLALKSIKGIGNATILKLLTLFKTAQSVVRQPHSKLVSAGLKTTLAEQITRFDFRKLSPVIEWLQNPANHLICYNSPFYPPLLAQIHNPPALLFAIGNLELLATPQIAVVGSRTPSPQGVMNTQHLSQGLINSGITITSGLALGIDGEAHRSALQAAGSTIAVMGTGPDRIYPCRHRELAHQIAERGLILSERLPGESYDKGSFPQRNRIIAGLSLGTLVVEAAEKSGTLITAQYSLDESREVFAVPGSILNPLAKGCHKLIKQGAKLTECVEDILEDLPCIYKGKKPPNLSEAQARNLSKEDAAFLKFIDYDVTTLDTIVSRSQLTVDVVTNKLLLLELQGWVINSAGGFIRQ
ncbi:DNA-processing protein DprA [Aliikangiella sp. G2MR2-5]|uniref:DNA-processing protein DprA n=1 Tax=Aliikangiella sp. G2MR2-5 TaxID=2788943 RepID=UPI0018A8BB5C|nr:DNA-processing protein DprA [Aliikangiella sp. G2MR2-5]